MDFLAGADFFGWGRSRSDDRTGDDIPHSMDTAKIRALGLAQFRTIPQMFGDCIRSFREKGFL